AVGERAAGSAQRAGVGLHAATCPLPARAILRRLVPMPGSLQIALGADHGGCELKEALKLHLREKGHSIRDFGTQSKDPDDYPKIARAVAESVASGATKFGIMVDGAGI